MRSLKDEVMICLPHFTRLCVASVVETGNSLDECAKIVARKIYNCIPETENMALVQHFERTLEVLVRFVSALSPNLPPHVLRDFAEKTSESQVSGTLLNALTKAASNSTSHYE